MRRLRKPSMAISLLVISLCGIFAFSGCAAAQSGGGGPSLPSVLGGALPGHLGSAVRVATAFGEAAQDLTPENEYYIGRAVAANVMAAYPPSPDERVNMYLNLLGQTLAQASDRPDTFGGYHFIMLDTPEVNAFAAPGGLIMVSRGMIKLCKTEDELAAVLAHEISHVVGQHGLKAIKKGRMTGAVMTLAKEAARTYSPAQLSELTKAFEGSIEDITSSLINNGYSRDLEREADKGAVTILTRVGYDPNALVIMLTEMQRQWKPGGPGFAKTHPEPKDRVAEIKPMVVTVSAKQVSPARQKRFEAALRGM